MINYLLNAKDLMTCEFIQVFVFCGCAVSACPINTLRSNADISTTSLQHSVSSSTFTCFVNIWLLWQFFGVVTQVLAFNDKMKFPQNIISSMLLFSTFEIFFFDKKITSRRKFV